MKDIRQKQQSVIEMGKLIEKKHRKMNTILKLGAGITLGISQLIAGNKVAGQETKPNIIVILADDLGYGDIGCYGAKNIKTPNLDKLAKQGVRFTSFYSNGPECTPTRAALLTGRYQQRVGGLECAIGLGNIGRYEEARKLSDRGELGLPVAFNTLPSLLSKKGYNTALIGKWHLGDGEQYSPVAHGFDYSIGPLGGGVDYFHHSEPVGLFLGAMMEGNVDFYRNGQPVQREGYYMTHLITDESVEWLNNQKKEKPFFLYIPYTAPHEPIQGPDDYRPDKLTVDEQKGSWETYREMIEEMDEGIGQILQKLEEKGFAENTLVIFFSDNGPTSIGSAGPFSGHKGEVFEGGIRVPCIMKWPGKIPEGTCSGQMGISMDITASIAAITGGKPPRLLDGINLVGHIVSGKNDMQRTLFWRRLRGNTNRKAVRDNNLKYIYNNNGTTVEEYLFDLSTDSLEEQNLKDIRKDDFIRLQKMMAIWEVEVKAERYNLR
ncbi:MAG: sulfatase-like hydrolase/transferase [Bacteroidales bacterium]|nr:sulfatase-like hydrolase/transferase [Bacteroidales bacterium]